jgi:hypothetical protein
MWAIFVLRIIPIDFGVLIVAGKADASPNEQRTNASRPPLDTDAEGQSASS